MHWLIRSIVKNAIRVAGNALGSHVLPVGDYLAGIFDDACRHSSPEGVAPITRPNARTQSEMRETFGSIAQNPDAFRSDTQALLDSFDLEPRDKETAAAIVAQIPGRIRQSMRRPDDPSGKTVPINFSFDGPESLAPFLPERLPRFRIGDVAVPGTDLVVHELLGVGGFGEVWKATHRLRPHAPPVALKFCTDPAAVKSLHKEVHLIDRVASAGRHPHIVDLLGVYGLDTESPCLEYEYIDGGDLSAWAVKAHAAGKVDPTTVAQLMLVFARAVGHLHRMEPPVVHRDLKPANILMSRRDGKLSPKVADFGIGGVAAARELADARHATGATTSLGWHTPLYSSPQQSNFGPPDPRDDVFALGVIWYQLVFGDLGKTPQGGSWRRKFAALDVPERMVALIERCVDGEAAERPADAQVLADELGALLKPGQVPTPLETFLPPLAPLPGMTPLKPMEPMRPLEPLKPLKPFVLMARVMIEVPKAGDIDDPSYVRAELAVAKARAEMTGEPLRTGWFFKVTLNETPLGEVDFFVGRDLWGETAPGPATIRVSFVRMGKETAAKVFSIDLSKPGDYRLRFGYVKGLLTGMSGSTLEVVSRP